MIVSESGGCFDVIRSAWNGHRMFCLRWMCVYVTTILGVCAVHAWGWKSLIMTVTTTSKRMRSLGLHWTHTEKANILTAKSVGKSQTDTNAEFQESFPRTKNIRKQHLFLRSGKHCNHLSNKMLRDFQISSRVHVCLTHAGKPCFMPSSPERTHFWWLPGFVWNPVWTLEPSPENVEVNAIMCSGNGCWEKGGNPKEIMF